MSEKAFDILHVQLLKHHNHSHHLHTFLHIFPTFETLLQVSSFGLGTFLQKCLLIQGLAGNAQCLPALEDTRMHFQLQQVHILLLSAHWAKRVS